FSQATIGEELISAQHGAFRDILLDERKQRLALCVRDNARNDVAAALDHAKNHGLFGILTGTASGTAVLATSDKCFVDLHMARETVIAVHFADELPNLMTHPPCGFVGHTQLAL